MKHAPALSDGIASAKATAGGSDIEDSLSPLGGPFWRRTVACLIIVVPLVACLAVVTSASRTQTFSHSLGAPVTIVATGLHSGSNLLPFDSYKLPMCRPPRVQPRVASLGQFVLGERAETSGYVLSMGVDTPCTMVRCLDEAPAVDAAALAKLESLIERGYRGRLLLDGVSSIANVSWGYARMLGCKPVLQVQPGYALGVPKACTGGSTLVHNHLEFRLQYERLGEDAYRVVGFAVTPHSVRHAADGSRCSRSLNARWMGPVSTDPRETRTLHWTYAARWEQVTAGAPRNFDQSQRRQHLASFRWNFIGNTTLAVLVLLSVLMMMLARTIQRDFAVLRWTLEAIQTAAAQRSYVQATQAWKVLEPWAAAPPAAVNVLIVAATAGLHLLGVVAVMIMLACAGVLTEEHPADWIHAFLLLHASAMGLAGYVSGRMLQRFSKPSWTPVVAVGGLAPAVLLCVVAVFSILAWVNESGTAVPPAVLLVLVLVTIVVPAPLLVAGASLGFRDSRERREAPAPPPPPRALPPQPWHARTGPYIVLTPLIPFGAVCLELRLGLAAWWQESWYEGAPYDAFGFLNLVFLLWLLQSALVAAFAVYARLAAENYRWWWAAFWAPAGGGLPVAVFWFFASNSQPLTPTGWVLYACCGAAFTMAYALAAGAVGVVAGYYFQRYVYSRIHLPKADERRGLLDAP